MTDYIDREAALRPFIIDKNGQRIPEVDGDNFPVTIEIKEVKRILRALPASDAKPVVHGKWVYNERTCREECSVCGIHNISAFRDFCPNCGADML